MKTINEVIEELEKLRAEHGNIQVICNQTADGEDRTVQAWLCDYPEGKWVDIREGRKYSKRESENLDRKGGKE